MGWKPRSPRLQTRRFYRWETKNIGDSGIWGPNKFGDSGIWGPKKFGDSGIWEPKKFGNSGIWKSSSETLITSQDLEFEFYLMVMGWCSTRSIPYYIFPDRGGSSLSGYIRQFLQCGDVQTAIYLLVHERNFDFHRF